MELDPPTQIDCEASGWVAIEIGGFIEIAAVFEIRFAQPLVGNEITT